MAFKIFVQLLLVVNVHLFDNLSDCWIIPQNIVEFAVSN